jgi:1-acyl-sn-glycerol-3-phosphate acyltransferase
VDNDPTEPIASSGIAVPRHRWLGQGINDWVYGVQRWFYGTVASTVFSYRSAIDAPLPAGPLLVASNHTSFLDPPLMGWPLLRPITFLARDTLGNNGILRRYLARMGVILIRRDLGKDGITKAIDAAKAGKLVMLFPEGTRSWNGWVQPFKSGARLVASKSGAPTVPAYGCGYYYALPRFRKLPRPAPLMSIYGEPLPAPKPGDNGAAWDAELYRRVLALEERGRAEYRKVFSWFDADGADARYLLEARAYASRKGINLASQIGRGPGGESA